jgi:tetratricopeptide (TPR) repeat protein
MRFILALLALICVTSPAQAVWRQADTRHFRFYSEGREEGLRAFAIKVERFDSVLRNRFGVSDADDPQKLTIFLVPTAEAVAKLAKMGKNVAGFYHPSASGSLAVVHRESASGQYDLSADTVLFHEYAHHFMLRYFPVAYPAWYVEGFAEFIATTDFTKEGNSKVGLPPYFRAYGLIDESPIPVQQILSTSVDALPGGKRDRFYGRSWLLVHYLSFAKAREGQLTRYLVAINGGATSLDAAKSVFGDLAVLDKDLKAYLDKSKISYQTSAKAYPIPDKIDVAQLSPGASALVPFRLALALDPAKEQRPEVIASLRKITGLYPGEAEGFRLLGEALVLADDFVGADQAADAALKLSPGLSRALLIKAMVASHNYQIAKTSTDDLTKAMKGWIVKANRADPNDPLPLLMYHRSFALQGLKPNKTALDGLARAYQMVPEAEDVRFAYAASLASTKQFDAAIRLIETLAYAPHGGPGTQYALTILGRLKKAKAGDAEAVEEFVDNREE